jgi:hypothetical protein
MSHLRGAAVFVLIALGGLLTIPSAILAWSERNISDEDRFVDTVNEAFDNEDVQLAAANRLTDTIMVRADVEQRVADSLADVQESRPRLPQGLALLQGPITEFIRDAIFRASVRLLESERLADVRETALRGAHRAVQAIIQGDGEILAQVDDKIVIDLQPLLIRIAEELGAERGAAFIEGLDLPEGAGQIQILDKSENPTFWTLVAYLDDTNPFIWFITAGLFIAGILLARNKPRAIMASGAVIAGVAAILLIGLIGPVKTLALEAVGTGSTDAAEALFDILVRNFQIQQLFVILIGVAMFIGGWAVQDREWTGSVSARVRGREDAPGFQALARRRLVPLRAFGLALGALVLLFWPDPSTGFVIGVLVVMALYLLALELLSSDAQWAVAGRSHFGRLFGSPESAGDGWVANHIGWLRAAGVIVILISLGFLIADFSLRGLIAIVALGLLYFAGLEALAGGEESADEGEPAAVSPGATAEPGDEQPAEEVGDE